MSFMIAILYAINNVNLVVPPEIERKGVRKCAERVEAGLLIHLPSGAETQLWMHKRPWPEGKATVYRAFTVDGWSYCSGQF